MLDVETLLIYKISQTAIKQEISIEDITLLSEDEHIQAKALISHLNECWWLRSPLTDDDDNTGYVICDGSVTLAYVDYNYGVRPALQIKDLASSQLEIGDMFTLAGYSRTVILPNMALCDDIVGYTPFRSDYTASHANIYEYSDIKKWLKS